MAVATWLFSRLSWTKNTHFGSLVSTELDFLSSHDGAALLVNVAKNGSELPYSTDHPTGHLGNEANKPLTAPSNPAVQKVVKSCFKRRNAPQFMLVGEAKCGTTSLWGLFRCSKYFRSPQVKEVCGNFLFDYFEQGNSPLELDLDKLKSRCTTYANKFPKKSNWSVTGDACTYYLSDYRAPALISRFFPWLKILIVVREPSERYLSNVNHVLKKRKDKTAPYSRNKLPAYFNRQVQSDIQRYRTGKCSNETLIGAGPFQSDGSLSCLGLKRGYYFDHIQHYLNYFSPSKVKVVLYEELSSPDVLHEILDFLSMSCEPLPSLPSLNAASPHPDFHVMKSDVSEALQELKRFYYPKNTALFELLGRKMPQSWRTSLPV